MLNTLYHLEDFIHMASLTGKWYHLVSLPHHSGTLRSPAEFMVEERSESCTCLWNASFYELWYNIAPHSAQH